jgi:hypothetical protein
MSKNRDTKTILATAPQITNEQLAAAAGAKSPQIAAPAPVPSGTVDVLEKPVPEAAKPLPASAPTAKKPPLVLVQPHYSVTDIITAVVPNPKRVGTPSHDRYAKYQVGMSVLDYLTKSDIPRAKASADLRFDLARKYITLTPKAAE